MRRRRRRNEKVKQKEEQEGEDEERRQMAVSLTSEVARRSMDRKAARASVESHPAGTMKNRGSPRTDSTHRGGSL